MGSGNTCCPHTSRTGAKHEKIKVKLAHAILSLRFSIALIAGHHLNIPFCRVCRLTVPDAYMTGKSQGNLSEMEFMY